MSIGWVVFCVVFGVFCLVMIVDLIMYIHDSWGRPVTHFYRFDHNGFFRIVINEEYFEWKRKKKEAGWKPWAWDEKW